MDRIRANEIPTPEIAAHLCDPAAVPRSTVGAEPQTAGLTDIATGFWDNHGQYMPRLHCMQSEAGGPDWPWIIILVLLTGGVIAFYLRIMAYWLRSHYSEAVCDRNRKMFQLGQIFFWCAVCGYGMSLLMFVWPAYRLLALFLLVLNIWSWRFCWRIDEFGLSLQAKRLDRELRESLEARQVELERTVAERTAELELARQEADRANQAKSAFLANMSHEIRTPMTSILGYADLLGDDTLSPAERADFVQVVRRSGTHLLGVINDVLDLSKIEAGALNIERISVDIDAVLADVVSMFQGRAAARGIELTREPMPPIGLRTTDPTRIRQILVNLVSNAIKFTERGSVTIGVRDEGQAIVFEVRDTGVGIDSDELDRIFMPFTQADSSTSRVHGGTGLGLTITQRLACLLGGEVEAESTPGVGSTFRVQIIAPSDRGSLRGTPAAEDDGAAPAGVTAEALRGIRVLVVDDNRDTLGVTMHMLRRAGAEPTTAVGGPEAIELVSAATDGFDLVLMDLQMPGMSGDRAAEQLRVIGFAGPILAFTAWPDYDTVSTIGQRFDGLVTKPIEPTRLIHAIRDATVRRPAA